MEDCQEMALYHSVYNDVISKLKAIGKFEEIMMNMQLSKDDAGKIHIVDQVRQNGHLNTPKIPMTTRKSDNESTRYRRWGNNHFAAKTTADYLIALNYYNQSICYAENNSEALSLGFANRSAVYFVLELYGDCLQNINLAKELPYPTQLIDKLNDRQAECLRLRLTDEPAILPRPKLSFPGRHKVPSALIANCLELRKNSQYRRHVITTRDLKAGDVVAIEEPFCSSVPSQYQYERCQNCLAERNRNLLPCPHCSSVMFCGKTCYDEAYAKFHKFECPVIGYIEQMFCEDTTATFRAVVCAVTNFDSVDELITFVQENKMLDLTVFDCNYKKKNENSYGPVLCLAEKRYNNLEEFVCCIIASLIYQPLIEHTDFKKMFTTTTTILALKELVLHTMKTMAINLSKTVLLDGTLSKTFSVGVYPFRSMLNHSCAPNMIITTYEKTMVFTVSRPIEAGEQIFDNYDVHFSCDPLPDRQNAMEHFTCRCVACENAYPMFRDLPKSPIPSLETIDVPSMKSVEACADYINKYAEYYPSRQLVFAEGELQYHLEATYKEKSLEIRFS